MLRIRKDCRATVWYWGKFFVKVLVVTIPLLCVFPWTVLGTIWTSFTVGGLMWILGLVVDLIVLIIGFVRFLQPFWAIHKCNEHDVSLSRDPVATVAGAPRTGKTFSNTYDVGVLAEQAAYQNQVDYFEGICKAETEGFADIDDFYRFKLIEDSFLHEFDGRRIPFLYANYGIMCEGLSCTPLKMEHFLQKERLPEGVAGVFDESASELSNKRSTVTKKQDEEVFAENQLLDETFSGFGHFYDGHLRFAEQDFNENYIGLRRVNSYNRFITAREELCRPAREMRKYDKLGAKIVKQGYCTPRQYKARKKYKKLIRSVGFFRFWHKDFGMTQIEAVSLGEGYYILPVSLKYQYETRAYAFRNQGLHKPFTDETFEGKYVDPRGGR